MSAVPFGPGIDIWRSCRFIGVMMRSLCLLPGGLARFVPCFLGANHIVGFGIGLTSRLRESASGRFLDQLLPCEFQVLVTHTEMIRQTCSFAVQTQIDKGAPLNRR